ncbi:DUF4397 domain-containing protein [Deinococcus koreensis]|uniref:DUF4397 domain-containing protein n=1 Tax=Deinococcus koreensis TaxID=2054903 RepID=A0A2K3UXS1_9DEIO|nr:DUF4397 domain-containing protein [Deinococcus koreensis]PNY81340.1 hypothetical protein CVO96_08035 [Deinococcus koreensis]
MKITRLTAVVCTLSLALMACGTSTPQAGTQPAPAQAATAAQMSDAQAQTMLGAESLRPSSGAVTNVTYAFKGTVTQGPSTGTVLAGDLKLKVRALRSGLSFLEGTLAGTVGVRGLLFKDGSSILVFDVEPQGIIGRGKPGEARMLSGVFFGPDIGGGDRGTWTATLQAAPPAEAPKSGARALHASSDTPAVDLLIDGAKVSPAGGFAFRTTFPNNAAGGGYAQLPSGKRQVKVCAAGTTVCPVAAALNLAAGTRYTVAVIGTLSPDDDHGKTPRPLTPLVLQDSAASKPDKAQVRLVHAAATPAANLVDVYVTAPGADIGKISPAIADFQYSKDSGYLPLPPGDYQVRITLPHTKTVVIDSGKLSLMAGKVFTAFAVDPLPGTQAFGAVLLQDN